MNRKLLLADESITIQRVIELTFAGENVDVVAVSDGEQAIQRIPLEKPDIVLADIGMRKRSGYEVAAFVKQHAELSHVPVVLLAGAFEPVDEARARQVRSDGILVKPFEPHQVVARVRELLDARPAARVPEPGTRDSGLGTRDARSGTQQPAPESRIADPEPATSLDDYFDRLDAAFAVRGNVRPPSSGGFGGASNHPPAPPAAPGRDDRSTGGNVPTIEDVLTGASLRPPADAPALGRVAPPPPEPPDASSTLASSPRSHPTPPPSRSNPLAHAFNLLLAVEQGELDSSAIRIGPRMEITDELVDRVTRQVLERLAPATARNIVAEIVSEIAERLVHEEIERIKKA